MTTYTKHWPGKVSYNKDGKLDVQLRTSSYTPTNFDELFIQLLSDYTQHLTPTEDGLQRAHEFRELFIQVMLEAQDEYNPQHSYTLP